MSEKRIRLSAGILTADLTRLGAEVELLAGQADYVHVDVMDGAFCPQLTVGMPFVKAVAATGAAVDAHLMVEEPRRFLPDVVAAGARLVTIHVESTRYPHRALQELTELAGPDRTVLRGLALHPGTPVGAIEPLLDLVDLVLVVTVNPGWSGQGPAANSARRVAAVRRLIVESGRDDLLLGVDGGVTRANLADIAAWQPDLIVSGSAIFNGGDVAANLRDTITTLSHAATLRPDPIGAR
jgi:ribulose-phosphate 3-epimerase